MSRVQPDRWSRWLLARRDGGDDAQRAQSLEYLGGIRDLVQLALGAGFAEVHCGRHITVEPGSSLQPVSFDALLDTAPNPHAPTIREALTAALHEDERAVFLEELRRAFQDGRAQRRMAVAYLRARL